MKNRKSMAYFVAVLVMCSTVFSNAARKDEVTLVMVPREEAMVRLGVDIANKYPTLLISYKLGANGAVSLHGWTGSDWLNVSLEDFLGGNFFKKGPDSALIVEKAGVSAPGKMLPSPDWCASAFKITTTEMRPLLHLVGQYYDFSFDDWKWFSKRYTLDMDAINPEGLNVAWYHKRMSEHLKTRDEQGLSDLQYWVSIYQPVVLEPEAPGEKPMEEAVAVPPLEEEVLGNPLTNDAPAAVIMGAADADEEHSEASTKTVETPVEEQAPEKLEAPAPAVEPVAEETATENSEEL